MSEGSVVFTELHLEVAPTRSMANGEGSWNYTSTRYGKQVSTRSKETNSFEEVK